MLIGKTFLTFAPSKVKSNKIHTTMKKFFTFVMLVLTVMALGSCNWSSDDPDRQEARVLEGTWTGYIDTYYWDRWGLTGNSYRTAMNFVRRDSYGGWGYEVDYNLDSPYENYAYCEFEWEVYRGDILITYADSKWNTVAIYDYALSSNRFWGYMDDGTSRDIAFELFYDGNFNWQPYRVYYAPTRGAGETPRYHASGEFAKKTDEGTSK